MQRKERNRKMQQSLMAMKKNKLYFIKPALVAGFFVPAFCSKQTNNLNF
jgi:hypothetical protein